MNIRTSFTRPEQVILLAEQNREIAEKLFKDHLPCALEIVYYIKKFTRLNTASEHLAAQCFMYAAGSFFEDENPSITTLFKLSDCYGVVRLPSEDFLAQLKNFLSSSQCKQLIKLLSQRAVFELFQETAHPKFVEIALPIAALALPGTSQHWGTLYGQQRSEKAATLPIDVQNTTQGAFCKS